MQQAHYDVECLPLYCAQAKPCVGFTTIELIITITILAIITVMAVPSFAAMYNRQKLESSAREIVMKVSEARSQAVLLRETTGICLATLSEDDCAIALGIPKAEAQRIFIARFNNGVTKDPLSANSLSFRNNGSITTQTNFIIVRNGISYCIQVGIIGDTTIKEGACT